MSENADIPAVNEDSNRHSYPPVLPDEAVGASATASTSQDGGEHSGNKATSAIARPATRASSYATANESDDDDGEQYGQYRGIGPLSLEASQRAAASPLSVQARPVDGHESSDNDVNEDEDGDTHSSHSSEAIETGMTPAAQLRLSLARRLWSGVTQLRSRSRCVLLFQGAFTIAQVGAFITMLALSAHQPCNKPLRVFIALHVIRIVVAYPISFYNALAPPHRPPRGEEDTPESRERREARRVIGNPRLDSRLRTASDFLSLFSFVWFFLGNVWVYSGGQCRDTSPYMWYSSLSILIIAYIRVAELVIIILAVVFFLPLVIMVLRLFGGLEKKHEIGPLTKEEIAKLPTVYYIPAPPEAKEKISSPTSASGSDKPTEARRDHASMPSETSAIGSDGSGKANENDKTATKPKRRRHLLRILFKPRRSTSKDSNDLSKAEAGNLSNGPYVPTKYPLHPLPDNLSSCPICLSDYEAPPLLTASAEERDKALEELEPLTLLPCSHSIHKDCLAPWLQTSGRCPVCQRAVLGEKQGKQKKGRLRLRRRSNNRTQGQSQSQEDNSEAPTPASVNNANATSPSRDSAPPISAIGALPPPTS